MSVRQHKSGPLAGRWLVDHYGKDGRRIRITLGPEVGAREQAEAQAALLCDTERETLLPTGKNFSELWPAFEKHLRAHMSPRTLADMRMSYKKHILPHLGRVRLLDLAPGHFDMYKTARLAERYCPRCHAVSSGPKHCEVCAKAVEPSPPAPLPEGEGRRGRKAVQVEVRPTGPRSVNKEIAYIRSLVKWAAEMRLAPPLKFTVRLLKDNPPKPQVLTPAEVVALVEACEALWLRCLVLCMYEGAMRRSEALGLRWADIWWEQRLISVKGKGGVYRLVPLDGWLEESLRELRAEADWEGPIFINRRTSRRITDFRKALGRAAAKAGIKRHINPHLLRHSQATEMAGANVNLRHIQTLLGHKSLKTTEIYMHLAAEHIRGSVANLPKDKRAKLRDTAKT